MNTSIRKKLGRTLGLTLCAAMIGTAGFTPSVYAENTSPFSDVAENSWYAADIEELESADVVNGYAGGVFRPVEWVSRCEFVKMMAVLSEVDEKTIASACAKAISDSGIKEKIPVPV